MSLRLNNDGTLPYSRDERGQPFVLEPVADTIVNDGEGGGPQSVSLLGPFTVTFDDPGLSSGIQLAPLATTQFVFAAWVEPTIPWDANADTARIDVCAGGSDWANGDFWPITQALVGTNVAYGTDADTHNAPAALPREVNGAQNRPIRLKTAGALVAQAVNVSGATAGAADIYVLIATPSE